MVSRASDPGMGLGILRIPVVTETAANTLTSISVQTPTSPAARVAMRLWSVTLNMGAPNIANPAADVESIGVAVATLSTRPSLTTMPSLDNAGTIATARMDNYVTSAPADAGQGAAGFGTPIQTFPFQPFGLLIAAQELTLYVQGTGLQDTISVRGYCLYTLDRISPEELVAALSVELPV